MALKKSKREEIRRFLIDTVEKHPADLVKTSSDHFNISRQAIRNYVNYLVANEVILMTGVKKGIRYGLITHEKQFTCPITEDFDESLVWEKDVLPFIPRLKENVQSICSYGFTEMLNNIKDHSQSSQAYISVSYDALRIKFMLIDTGIGIFTKIQGMLHLENKSDAILELAKGKLTSDPEHHSGEGIFFTSRLFDNFSIVSDNLYFRGHDNDDWLLEAESTGKGTGVFMLIYRESPVDPNAIFNKFADPDIDDYGFLRTHFQVRLLKHEGEELVSRSQAKRLVLRLGQFKEVLLDFSGIMRIGQGFADEIFRVFKNKNPNVNLIPVNMSENVEQTIKHVMSKPQGVLL